MSLERITGADLEAEVERLYALLEGKTQYVDCVCPGCPRKVPEVWASGMCQPCASEDCEHTEGTKDTCAQLMAALKREHAQNCIGGLDCEGCAIITRFDSK